MSVYGLKCAHGSLGEGREGRDILGVIADVHIAFPPLDRACPGRREQQVHQQYGAQHAADIAQCDRQSEASLRLSSACDGSAHALHRAQFGLEPTGVRVKDLERNGLILMTISMARVAHDQR